MTLPRTVFFTLAFSLLSGTAQPREPAELPLVGEATYRYLLWTVYDASLRASDEPFSHSETRPFALSLEYRRAFSARDIIKESARQLRSLGVEDDTVTPWMETLAGFFPDINKGDCITLEVDEDHHSHFYLNGSYLDSISDRNFSHYFSGIWLSDDSQDPQFTASLRGQ